LFLYYSWHMVCQALLFKGRSMKVVQPKKWIEFKVTGTMALTVDTYINAFHSKAFVVSACSCSY